MQIRTTQNVAIDYTPASAMHRAIAGVIDALVMFMVLMAAILLTGWVMDTLGSPSVMFYFVTYGLVIAYPLIMETLLNGRTLGKLAMKTRVVRLDGRRATFGSYLLRWLLGLFEILMTSGGLAFVLVIITKKHQRLGDMAAGTSVVMEPKPVTLDQVMLSAGADAELFYPAARFLTEDEAETIRQVLMSSRSGVAFDKVMELLWTTAEALQSRMGEETITDPWVFLTQVLESYQASHREVKVSA